MKCFYRIIVYLCCVWMTVACQNKHRPSSLKETEYYFDERLSSISAEGDSLLWLGSECGDLRLLGKGTNDAYHISYNRIYDVYTHRITHGVRTCWVGMRNEGLQQWNLTDGQATLVARYPIPYKGMRYSAYDIQRVDSCLFIATSQGLMVLDRKLGMKASLRCVYPGTESDTQKNGAPFVVRNCCLAGSSTLVAATERGLLHVDISTMKTWMTHQNEHIKHIAMYGDSLHILGEATFYIESLNGEVLNKTSLDFDAQYFYRAVDTFCFIDKYQAWLTDDLESFIPLSLRRKVPPESTNLSHFNEHQGFTFLITDNALWRIPVHLDMFSNHAPIVAACASGNGAYYVTSKNEIFRQREGTQEARRVFDFLHEPSIVNVVADGKTIYYTNIKNEVRSIRLTEYLLSNLVFAHSKMLYQSEAKITTFGLHHEQDSTYLYMGIQDGLVRIDTDGSRADTLHLFDNKYVTSLFSIPKSQLLYLTTLNHGVFMSKHHVFKSLQETDHQHTMLHMAMTEDFPPRMVTLSSQSIVMQGGEDTIRVKGMNRVFFANDSILYGVPDYGLKKYVRRGNQLVYQGTYFRDVRFNTRGIVAMKGSIYLGSAAGVLCVRPNDELASQWVKITDGFFTRRMIALALLVLLLGLAIVYSAYRRYIAVTKNHICARKQELVHHLNDLKQVSLLLESEEERTDLEMLEQQIEAITLGHAIDIKQANEILDGLSEQIMQHTANSVLLLFKQMDKQTQQIKDLEMTESKMYLKDTSLALATGVIDAIREQALKNDAWLKRVHRVEERMDEYLRQLDGTLTLEGVTMGLVPAINQLKEQMIIYPIERISKGMEELSIRYEALFDESALERIKSYCSERRLLLQQVPTDGVQITQLSELDVVMKQLDTEPRLEELRRLRLVDCRIDQLLIKQKLASVMGAYSARYAEIVVANDLLVNKLFGRKLETAIAEDTRNLTDEIVGLVQLLYQKMVVTDYRLLNEVLGITNFEHQQARVLALLLANPKVKRIHIPGMLGVIGNLNPVISRLMKNKILAHQDEILHYKQRHPASLVTYILSLV